MKTGFQTLRNIEAATITAGASEAAPAATATDFTQPTMFPGADSLELAFAGLTVTGAATMTVFVRQRVSGVMKVIPYKTIEFTAGQTIKDAIQLADVPLGDWTVRVTSVAATTGDFVGEVLARYYQRGMIQQ